MVTSSVFGDRAMTPQEREVEDVLGPAYQLWTSLRDRFAVEFDPCVEAWTYAGRNHGWSLRLNRRDRPIVYLTPLAGRFRASLALPERAIPAVLEADLPPPVQAIVANAQHYAEGRAVRIDVESEAHITAVATLARIRMAC